MSEYTKLLVMQYRSKPKAVATIKAFSDEAEKIAENAIDLINQIDIDQAKGFSLDIVGRRVGVSRVLDGAVSKGYLGYLNSIGGEPWGVGRWYRKGEAIADSLTLNDSDFRFLIKAKIFKNFQLDTLDYLHYVLGEIIGDGCAVQDNFDMTVTILLPLSNLNTLQVLMIQQLDILPRPMGVMYNYINASGKEFGFDGFFNSYGFNDGKWIDA